MAHQYGKNWLWTNQATITLRCLKSLGSEALWRFQDIVRNSSCIYFDFPLVSMNKDSKKKIVIVEWLINMAKIGYGQTRQQLLSAV
jgi:hypothetical protein